MMANFSGSGHPIFRVSSAFGRGELRSKEGGKESIHFNGSHEKHRVASPHRGFCESGQYVRKSSRFMKRRTRRS